MKTPKKVAKKPTKNIKINLDLMDEARDMAMLYVMNKELMKVHKRITYLTITVSILCLISIYLLIVK